MINTITGKIVGLGPQLVEVDAPFQPGNSGSPIIHLKSGKVIGVATYAIIRKYDPSTKEPVKEPVIRRFGYRLDSIKTWQPVAWPAFSAQAAEMEALEKLTGDLGNFLDDLAHNGHVTRGANSNPVIKNRIDSWLDDRAKRLSPRDAAMADQSFLSFLKITCQNDVTAARQHLTYDYFQRGLVDQQRERNEISGVFDEIIQNLGKGKLLPRHPGARPPAEPHLLPTPSGVAHAGDLRSACPTRLNAPHQAGALQFTRADWHAVRGAELPPNL